MPSERSVQGTPIATKQAGSRDERDVSPFPRPTGAAHGLAHHPLAAVPNNCVARLAPRDEDQSSNTTITLRALGTEHCQKLVYGPISPAEDLVDLAGGPDRRQGSALIGDARPHETLLGGDPDAALGPAGCKDGPAACGRHARTETVGLLALASIGLVRALHVWSLRVGARCVSVPWQDVVQATADRL